MTALPPDLAPWASELESLPIDLATALGPWLRRLAVAIGPLRRRTAAATGEVDGFEGLASRGPVERLLVSEWMLADALPEEFFRRAVQGELSYLQLARRSPAGDRRCIALFDSGPDQIGAPRLAQMATLVVLARRASAANAILEWGVLQAPDDGLVAETGEAGVRRLLASHTAKCAVAADLSAWRNALAEQRSVEEAWWIGAALREGIEGRRRLSPRMSVVEIEDSVEPGKRTLELRIQRAALATSVDVELELPPEQESVRLLRDPYRPAPRRPSLSAVRGHPHGLHFSSTDRRLIVAREDGAIDMPPVPYRPAAPAPSPPTIRVPTKEVVVGAQFARGRAMVLSADARRLRLRSRGEPVDFNLPVGWCAPDPWCELQPSWRQRIDGVPHLLLVDGAGTMYRLNHGLPGMQPEPMLDRALAPRYFDGALHCLCAGDGCLEQMVSRGGREFIRVGEAIEVELESSNQIVVGRGSRGLAVAVERDHGHWLVHPGGGASPSELVLAPGTQLQGLLAGPTVGPICAVVLEPDCRTIALLNVQTGCRLHTLSADAEIDHLSCSPVRPLVAYVTQAGEVIAANLIDGERLVRLRSDGP